jgi:transcriptional regulator with PAS, ATPase and Fis domain
VARPPRDSIADASTAARQPRARRLQLLVFSRDGHTAFPLAQSGVLVVGRGRDAGVRVDDMSVSREHIRIHLGTPLRVEDLGSANGTRIGGRTLAPNRQLEVPVGAVIEVGDVRVVACSEHVDDEQGDAPMDRARELAMRAAPSDVSVLLIGETGAGKEVLAEEIHRHSRRAAGPFLRLNCAAMPAQLLESELFGYERGAFTGALQAKPGLLESAQGGTVLLDEVGDMPATSQAKLLRVLESREVLRVGALRPRALDVRFISATHRDLDVLVVMEQFRRDLLFRLNGMTIRLSPLRERLHEIPTLAETLLGEASVRVGRPKPRLSSEAALLLASYRWPGNVRELRNVLERAVLVCDDGTLGIEHLTFGDPGGTALSDPAAAPQPVPEAHGSEQQRIEAALRQTHGNQKEAARLLGISRRVLVYKLDKLGLPRPRKRPEEDA